MSKQDRRIRRGHEADRRAAEIVEETKLRVARAAAVPMSIVDGRPWVPTAAEADAGEEELDTETSPMV